MTIVRREPVAVLYVRAENGPAGAGPAFARLEKALGGPKGRRFLGWFFRGEYRACVVRKDGDDPVALGLAEDVIPGGDYAKARHEGPAPTIHETFRRLLEAYPEDRERPSLEDYRRHDEVIALLPVLSGPTARR